MTIEAGREAVARLVGAAPDDIVLTSGGTEANNLALYGAALTRGADVADRRRIVISGFEHPSVRAVVEDLGERGFEVVRVDPDRQGRVDPGAILEAAVQGTAVVSLMLANNEVGTVQPIEEIGAVTRRHGVLLHVDAAQSVGKIPVSVETLGADLLTVAGHKFYAPKGIGALYVRAGVDLQPIVFGASQEQGRRPGTENVPYIAGLGVAAALARVRLPAEGSALRALRDRLHRLLQEAIPGLTLNGHPGQRLPGTLNVSFPGVDARALLAAAAADVAASVGAACHAHGQEVSGVLAAMGVAPQRALGAVRLSVGRFTQTAAIERAAAALIAAYRQQQGATRRG